MKAILYGIKDANLPVKIMILNRNKKAEQYQPKGVGKKRMQKQKESKISWKQ